MHQVCVLGWILQKAESDIAALRQLPCAVSVRRSQKRSKESNQRQCPCAVAVR